MRTSPEKRLSIWQMAEPIPTDTWPGRDTYADVCIIGGGIAGLTTAYLLRGEGKSVVVLDDGPLGGGQTQRTTAHLSNAIDDRYFEIERIHGEQGAKLAADSHTAAIDLIEEIVKIEKISCDFARVDGYLFAPPGESGDVLDRELNAAHRAGLCDVKWVEKAPLATFDTGPCLLFPRQGQFHPMEYLAGLARATNERGGRLFTGAHVTKIRGGSPAKVEIKAGGVVTAEHVVVATNVPINDLVAIHTKQAPYLTYVIGARVPAGSVPRALYWDTIDPYHYVRLQRSPFPLDGVTPEEESEILIVGGEDHKTAQAHDADARHARLETWARERFPMIREVVFRWSGQVMETVDGLAFIGRNPLDSDNVYVATGDSGMGMTHGTIAGMLLCDLILGRENQWASLYDPSRKTLRTLLEYTKENLNVAAQYTAWLGPGQVSSVEEIPSGSGAVMRRGLTMVAVYRDHQNALWECSAKCPHLGCVVDWNHAEQTWDCPCHGSRFDRHGHVICGPANSDLTPIGHRIKEKV